MSQRLVFFDIETGGLRWWPTVTGEGKQRPANPIIQIAAVAVDFSTFAEVEAFEVKLPFTPESADPEALAINHFDPTVWEREAKPDGMILFNDFLERRRTVEKISARGRPYSVARLAGHNISRFDFPFVFERYAAAARFFPADFHVFDTMPLAVALSLAGRISVKDFKLATLCEALGVSLGDEAHDALADVRATVGIAQRMTAMIGGER